MLDKKIAEVHSENCYISEITIAELKFGAENSAYPAKNKSVINKFISGFHIMPIYTSLDAYAAEKARLRKAGNIIDEFDLLIGVTAVVNELILVTNNETHFRRIRNIRIENWIKK